MARLLSVGYELGSATAGVESTATGSVASVQSTTVRSGGYAQEVALTSSTNGLVWTFSGSNVNKAYARVYFRYATAPSADNCIILFGTTTVFSNASAVLLKLTSSGELELYSRTSSVDTQIGSASSALSTNTWYRVELHYDGSPASGSRVIEAKIDGTTFASTTTSTAINAGNGYSTFYTGGNTLNEGQSTGSWFFDDVAINDTTGSFQTGYPGDGKIIHLVPNAAGDNNQWGKSTGAAGDSSNYNLVDEVPPNDATDYVRSRTTGEIDDYNVASSGIGASDTVNVVAVGQRASRSGGTNSSSAVLRIKSASSGTVSEGTSNTASSSAFRTNDLNTNVSHPYQLLTYETPDTTSWTQSNLDTMQIGIRCDSGSGDRYVHLGTIWAMVDYTPVGGGGGSGPTNLKTLNGVTKANIKTIDGVAIANVKSVDGVA